jgi:hypothetical protein
MLPIDPDGTNVPINGGTKFSFLSIRASPWWPVFGCQTINCKGGRHEQVRTVSEPLFGPGFGDRVFGDWVASPARPTYS